MGERISPSTLSISEFFEEQAPFYLSIGMTHGEYWNGDPELARYSLKAFNLKQEREFNNANRISWLQGAYVHNAVYSAVSYCLNGKEAKRLNIGYFEEPFDFNKNNEPSEKEIEKAQQESLEWLQQLYIQTNKQFS